jgi:hypothetical protein
MVFLTRMREWRDETRRYKDSGQIVGCATLRIAGKLLFPPRSQASLENALAGDPGVRKASSPVAQKRRRMARYPFGGLRARTRRYKIPQRRQTS